MLFFRSSPFLPHLLFQIRKPWNGMTPAPVRFFPRSKKTVNTEMKGSPIPQDIHLLGFSLFKKKSSRKTSVRQRCLSTEKLYRAFNRTQSCSPHTQQNTQMISTTHSACKCHKEEPGTANTQVTHNNLH